MDALRQEVTQLREEVRQLREQLGGRRPLPSAEWDEADHRRLATRDQECLAVARISLASAAQEGAGRRPWAARPVAQP